MKQAIEQFALSAALAGDDKEDEVVYDTKVEELERTLDSQLHVLYLKQIAIIREKAMKSFKVVVAYLNCIVLVLYP